MSIVQRIIFLGLALVPLVLLAACGGDDAGPTSRTVTSDDGKLTLEIPPEALDEDVPITITAVPLEDLPEDLQVVQGAGDGYLLEPEGLQFSEPVAVSLELELAAELDDGIAAYALVSLTEDGERELLDELVTEATLGEDTTDVVARGELSHFSWITRTKGSLVVSLEKKPRTQPVGATFTANGSVGNGDFSNTVTLENPSGTFLAFGTVSTSGDTAFNGTVKLSPGESVKGTGTFKCDKPGLGTYTLRGMATSVVVVDGEFSDTPLTVTVDGVVECVEPTTTPTPTPAPTPTSEESSPSPTSGTASDPDEIYLDDPTDDATDCATGESVVDPAVEISGVALTKDGESIVVEVVTVQSPETTFFDFSAAIQVSLGSLAALAQIHDGQLDEGLFGSDGGLIPGSEEHVTWTDGGVSFLFPDAGSVSKGDPLLVETFHLKTEGGTVNCDTLMDVYSCFGRCDD